MNLGFIKLPEGSMVYLQVAIIVFCSFLRKTGYLEGSTYDTIVAILLGTGVISLKHGQEKTVQEVKKASGAGDGTPQ